jgi:hypothetical protein
MLSMLYRSRMKKKTVIVFTLLLLILLLPLPAVSEGEQASDSSQFHGDERHAGYIATVGPTSPFLAWKIKQSGDGLMAFSGILVVAQCSSGDWLYIINETDGNTLGKDWPWGLNTHYPVIGAGTLFYTASRSSVKAKTFSP